jgi:hypothetical protein
MLKVRTAVLNDTFDRDHRIPIDPDRTPYVRDIELHRPHVYVGLFPYNCALLL